MPQYAVKRQELQPGWDDDDDLDSDEDMIEGMDDDLGLGKASSLFLFDPVDLMQCFVRSVAHLEVQLTA